MNNDEMYWCGRPISELSRDELLNALKILAEQYVWSQKRSAEDLEYLAALPPRGMQWPPSYVSVRPKALR